MRVLLDTHVFLWWIDNDKRLSDTALDIIGDGRNNLFFSAASGWEIAIKAQIGKLELSSDLVRFVVEQLQNNAITSLPVQLNHALHTLTLPQLHRDPFDRILVAQSQVENLPILTADRYINQYNVETIW
jgi:PIN domain nuclease of toxin-antitoxin system